MQLRAKESNDGEDSSGVQGAGAHQTASDWTSSAQSSLTVPATDSPPCLAAVLLVETAE
jgi:hypothetical protein